MKKLLATLLAVSMAAALTACGGNAASEQEAPAEAPAAEANGDTLIAIDGQQNQAKQNDMIEDLITQGIEVLFLNPADSESVQPALEACADAGVKVINVDSAVADRSLIESYLASDNVEAGRQCGEEIAKAISFGARIVVMDEPTSSLSDREVEALFASIRNLTKKGIGIAYISHRMSELEKIVDRVTVMRDGEYIGTRETSFRTTGDSKYE